MKLLNFRNIVLFPGFLLGCICFLYLSFTGLWLPILIGWSLMSGLGIAVGFHRVYSHKTHDLHPWLDNLILLFGSIAGQGSSITWVAVHRGYHHRHCDTSKDLHSPIHGVWHSFLGWYSHINETTINHKFAVDLLRRKNHVWVHKNYLTLQLRLYALLLGLSFLTRLPIFQVYMACLFISLLQDNLVNTLCHIRKLGYKNHDSQDNSVNVPVLGYLTFGQAHHENHHANPARYNFGVKWWEFDPSLLWLPLVKLGSKNEQRKST